MMRPEDKSFWSGATHGVWDGAVKGFVIGGIIGVALLFFSGVLITGATLGALTIGFAQTIGVFVAGGAIGAAVGSPLGFLYEGINEYIEEKEVQRDCKRAHQLGFIENYKVVDPTIKKEETPTVIAEVELPATERSAVEKLGDQKEASLNKKNKGFSR